MTALSINVNKVALLRNSRGENRPDVLAFAKRCLEGGVAGITVHPRPDQRHIKYSDLKPLKTLVDAYGKELNIEGYPSSQFLEIVTEIKPHQVTLVPDPPHALTSSFGWDIQKHHAQLVSVLSVLKAHHIRTSLFIDETVHDESLSQVSPNRVELYTYNFAHQFNQNKEEAVRPYTELADRMAALKIEVNAGHDLNQYNTPYFLEQVPNILEVSIGHAFICDCLEDGFEKTLTAYVKAVQ